MENADQMKDKFTAAIIKSRESKAGNIVSLSNDKYNELIRNVTLAKSKDSKLPADYWLLKRYDVLSVQGIKKLIHPANENGDIKYFVKDSELFDVLYESHVAIGHKARDAMVQHINHKYKNVTQADIKTFLSYCKSCQEKRKLKKKGLVVKPLLFRELNARCQVDLIDYQTFPSNEFKFVMVYQDHLTKFVFLKSLTSKRAAEVAYNLLDVFTVIGAPSILQSDNGREFVNSIIENLKKLWPELKIVHGRPRHSQSQGSVERANQDIENMITTWMADNETNKWSEGLRFIQLMKNQSYHSGIKRSPYEAMFGTAAKIGLASSRIPKEIIPSINSEDDLRDVIEEMESHGTSSVTSTWDINEVIDAPTTEEIEEAYAAAAEAEADLLDSNDIRTDNVQGEENNFGDESTVEEAGVVIAPAAEEIQEAFTAATEQRDTELLNPKDVDDDVRREENKAEHENVIEELESWETSQTEAGNENQVADTTIAESVEKIVATAEPDNTSSSPNLPAISCFVCKTQDSSIDFYKCVGCGNSVDEVCCFKDIGNTWICLLCKQKKSILEERTSSYTALQNQAKKMKMYSDRQFLPVEPGTCVIIKVPDVDRNKGDAKNLIAVVLELSVDQMYKLGTKTGILASLYSRNQFQPCDQNFLRIEDVPDVVITLRSSAISQSKGSGQGYVRCSCATKCTNNRCKCRKQGLLCNSKCHSSLPCCNK